MMDITGAAAKRFTTKAYDAARRVPEEQMRQIYEVLRLSASSVNLQPWHFVVASTPEAKARLAKGAQGPFAYNEAKIRDASHVILFCVRADADQGHLDAILEQEARDGRYRDDEAKANTAKTRLGFINQHRFGPKDVPQWLEKQVYIALGGAMLAAAELGIDTTPMEGIDIAAMDKELDLNARGLTSLVVLSLGYHADSDFNAKLPKSRLPQEQVFTFL